MLDVRHGFCVRNVRSLLGLRLLRYPSETIGSDWELDCVERADVRPPSDAGALAILEISTIWLAPRLAIS